jgi:5-deoxy-glucuronate isomerase
MRRLIKARTKKGLQRIVRPGVLRFLDFSRLNLARGQKHSGKTREREYVLDIFSGTVTVTVEMADGQKQVFSNVGARADVFSGPPAMIYLPPQCSYRIRVESEVFDAGIFSAPSTATVPAALLEGAAVVAKQVGRDNWQRTVYSALTENVPAQRLLAGETLNPPGNWSSYPPHKHDQANAPLEAILEEVYFFRIKPAQGFGLMWTYTAADDPEGFSTAFVVEDGDTVLLPKGYHPLVAAPGYQLHYTWVLAGEQRRYGAWADDPRHSWLKDAAASG